MSRKTRISPYPASRLLSAIFAATHDFIPDFAFKGSSLTGWHTSGTRELARRKRRDHRHAAKSPDGGWLVLDKGYQDVEVLHGVPLRGELRCRRPAAGGKDAGRRVEGRLRLAFRRGRLVRADAERGRKRVEPDAPAASDRAVRAHGRGPLDERSGSGAGLRQPRHHAGRTTGGSVETARRCQPRGPRRRPRRPAAAADSSAGDWNTLDVIVDTDMVWTTLNGRRGGNSATSDRMMGYRSGCASCRGSGRGPVPRCCDQGSESQDGTGGASLLPLPHAAAQRLLLLVGRHRRRYQSRRHSGRDRRTVLLPGAGLHRAPRVHRGPQLQPE